jgi:hypothetical protein
MKTPRSRIRSGLLALVLTLLAPALVAQQGVFYVLDQPPFLDPPANTVVGLDQPLLIYPYPMPPVIKSPGVLRLETAYEHFKRAGYRQPALSPRVVFDNMNTPLLGIFYFDFSSYTHSPRDADGDPIGEEFQPSNLGVYIPGGLCNGAGGPRSAASSINWIALNSGNADKSILKENWIYSHELFHALQDMYPLSDYGCNSDIGEPPGWITEAIADAAAGYITQLMLPAQWKSTQYRFPFHLRSYRIAFRDESDWRRDPYFENTEVPRLSNFTSALSSKDKEAETDRAVAQVNYKTAGFWKFIARRSTGESAASGSRGAFDRLLAAWIPLYETRPEFSEAGWLGVVDDYIEKNTALNDTPKDKNLEGRALYGWLPEFFTEYATWWDQNYPQLGAPFKSKWHKYSYGGCETVTLKPSPNSAGSSATLELKDIRKNSARCIHVELQGFTGPVSVKARAKVDHDLYAEQLHLGLARVEAPLKNGKRVKSCWDYHDSNELRCLLQGKVEKSPPAKVWKKEQYSAQTLGLGEGPVSARLTYVLSNVNMFPENTIRIRQMELIFSTDYSFGGDKTLAPPNSIRPRNPATLANAASPETSRQLYYRLYTAPPIGLPGLFPIELNVIDDGEAPRCGGDAQEQFCAYDTGGDYYIRPGPNVMFGQTGRITATVHKNANNGPVLMSTYCSADADQRAVEILDSNHDGLVIRVNTDLCDVPGPDNNYCNKQAFCPVREHLLTTLTLGLGREHFGDTAAVHQLTPGTQFDMDLYFRYGVPGGSSSSSPASGSGSSSGSSSDSGSAGAGTAIAGMPAGTGGSLNNCNCSCEEREKTLHQAEDLKARKAAGENISGAAFMDLMGCVSACQSEYMICELEKNRQAEQTRDTNRQSRAETSCDCSCSALESLESRTQSLLENYRSGDQSALAEMQQLGQCMSVCQNEMMNCYKSK